MVEEVTITDHAAEKIWALLANRRSSLTTPTSRGHVDAASLLAPDRLKRRESTKVSLPISWMNR
jgi:hypothetical protein